MRYDNDLSSSKFWVSKEELYIISSSVIEFSQEMHWKLRDAKNKDMFEKTFASNFMFSLKELDYVECELWELEVNFRNINISEIFILFFENMRNRPGKDLLAKSSRTC